MSEKKASVITEEGRLCFDKNLFEANEDGKFQASMVIPEGTSIDNVKKLMMDVALKEYGSADKIPKKFTWGVKSDKDADIEKYPFLEGANLISGGTKFAIPVADIAGNEVDRDGIKGGDTVRFSLSAYHYEYKGKRGVSLNVNAVLLVKACAEEEAFYQKANAKSMFGDVFNSYADQAVDNFAEANTESDNDAGLAGMNF
jgi:hypothetical protein